MLFCWQIKLNCRERPFPFERWGILHGRVHRHCSLLFQLAKTTNNNRFIREIILYFCNLCYSVTVLLFFWLYQYSSSSFCFVKIFFLSKFVFGQGCFLFLSKSTSVLTISVKVLLFFVSISFFLIFLSLLFFLLLFLAGLSLSELLFLFCFYKYSSSFDVKFRYDQNISLLFWFICKFNWFFYQNFPFLLSLSMFSIIFLVKILLFIKNACFSV